MSNSTDYINRQIRFHTERRDARHPHIDKRTGERPYVWPEERRRKDQLAINQLQEALKLQERMDSEQATQRVHERNTAEQEERDRYNQTQAIQQRAQAIRVEREAQRLADSTATLTGPGSTVSIVSNA